MEESQGKAGRNSGSGHHQAAEKSEPVRSRWTPKPEQILILESIFNSGMVNPPKDETVRIRKLLEKFGSVGDANVFYWFQNRRSRSRRRQRQLQAGLQGGGDKIRDGSLAVPQGQVSGGCGVIHQYLEGGEAANYMSLEFSSSPNSFISANSPPSYFMGSSSSCAVLGENGTETFFPVSSHLGFQGINQQASGFCLPGYYSPSDTSTYHFGNDGYYVTIFINGIPTDVPSGSLDIRSLFGSDALLVHSSGLPVPTDEFGFLIHSLEHGESYFLVSKQP